jgi:[acyl-carrier-protein] S-malonyltransferase
MLRVAAAVRPAHIDKRTQPYARRAGAGGVMGLGFVFPGQGAQSVGMLADFRASEAVVRDCFDEADAALGMALGRIVAEGPESDLNRTEITQPAMLTASVALWRLWSARSAARPIALAGHSLGEYSALVAAGAIDFAEAVKLVHLRGKLMQRAIPAGEGVMAAILGLDDAQVEAACAAARAHGVVAPANLNAPGQVVIAGHVAAVEAAIAMCQAAGAKRAVKLAVSAPIHCELMRPAAAEFAPALAAVEIRMPAVPVVQNVDAGISTSVDALRDRLVRQLSEPVRWTACVERMAQDSVGRIVECGPGKVLSGLIRRIDRALEVMSLDSTDAFTAAVGEVGNG